MFRKHETEVLVVGAGPVGLFAAVSLAELGIQVEIVDEEWRTAARSYALALHPHTLELLEGLGLAEEVIARGHRIGTTAFYEGGQRRAEIHYGRLPGKFPFVLVLPQDQLEEILRRRLAERKVKVMWSHRVAELTPGDDDTEVLIEKLGKESTGYGFATTEWVVEKRSVTRAGFVIGADGHRSVVRRALGLGFEKLEEPDLYAVFEFASGAASGSEVRVVMGPDTTDVLWPLKDGRQRWSLQLTNGETYVEPREKKRLAVQVGKGAYPYLGETELVDLLARRAPWFEAAVRKVSWSVAVRFEHRLAEAFGRGNVWLAGDAAHLAAPLGMQSMNLGLIEAHELTQSMARILRIKASRELLASYGRERRRHWRWLLGLEGGVAVDGAGEWVRDHAARILPTIPASGVDLERLLAQLDLEPQLPEPVGR